MQKCRVNKVEFAYFKITTENLSVKPRLKQTEKKPLRIGHPPEWSGGWLLVDGSERQMGSMGEDLWAVLK